MDQALLTAAAGMRAQLEALEVLGNNIANSSTTAYKADREFYRLFVTQFARADPRTGEVSWMPVTQASSTDFRQGPLESTNAPLDLALEGPGFFSVRAGDAEFYTRAGEFHTSAGGELVTANGMQVLDDGGAPIVIPPKGEIDVAENGLITVGGLSVARLGVVEVDQLASLVKAGANLYAAPPDAAPRAAAATRVRQGALESSNVNVAEAAVRLVSATRSFEMLRRVASLIDGEMTRRAIDTLGSSG